MRGRGTRTHLLEVFFSSNSERQIMIHHKFENQYKQLSAWKLQKTVSNLPDVERFCVDGEIAQWIVTETQWINDEWKEKRSGVSPFYPNATPVDHTGCFWWNASIVKKNDDRNNFTFWFTSSTQNVGTNQILIYKKNKLNATKGCIIVGTTASVCPKVFIS